jgi:hypothetical protein
MKKNWEKRVYELAESSGIDEIHGDGKVRCTFVIDDLLAHIRWLLREERKELEQSHKAEMREMDKKLNERCEQVTHNYSIEKGYFYL